MNQAEISLTIFLKVK